MSKSVQFRKRLIDKGAYEAASAFDVNNDGILDIVCGAYWYEGPDYTKKHLICDVEEISGYYDDFSDFPMDVDGDGWTDIVTASFFKPEMRWRKNPGETGKPWEVFAFGNSATVETVRFYDIDGCGVPEVFPNACIQPACFYKLIRDENGKGTGEFRKVVIGTEKADHGMGFADVNGDGRMDIIVKAGWLEQPEDPFQTPWVFHQEFDLGVASVPILGHDINGDGLTDLFVGEAHNYGLYWMEQRISADGQRTWIKHDIDMTASQFHDMQLVDIDHDGKLELVTGKRYWAHNGHDPGESDPIGLYYYKINKGVFEKHVIDYGPPEEHSGTGIYFWIEDMNGNGRLDIVAPGKEGLYLFENLG